jgi:hypothetical protein
MVNPDPAAPPAAAGIKPVKQKPLMWLAEAYPYIVGKGKNQKKAHDEEFILLQRVINSPVKKNVSSSHWMPLRILSSPLDPKDWCSYPAQV